MKQRIHNGGFTLVEIMIALLIGLFLTAGMVQMYAANRQSYRFNDGLARIQENGRFAMEAIARDLRMAGFFGCSQGNNLSEALNPGGCSPAGTGAGPVACVACINEPVLGGVDVDPAGPAPNPAALPGTDSISIRGAGMTGVPVEPLGTSPAILNAVGTRNDVRAVLSSDLALVSDCAQSDLFQVTGFAGGSPTTVAHAAGSGTPGNSVGNLATTYNQTAQVYPWREVQFFVQVGAGGGLGLFRRENRCTGGAAAEIVEGIENIQFTYGEDTNDDGTANRYVTATALNAGGAARWNAVVSVRVELLLASGEDNLVDAPQVYNFGGANNVVAADRRLYQTMTSILNLRNRVL